MNDFGNTDNREKLRNTIYGRYGSGFEDVCSEFDLPSIQRWGKAYRWYLRHWLPGPKEAVIADLACGNGRLLYFLKDQGYRNLYGVDISPDQVALARHVVPDVVQADVLECLADKKHQFDLIVSLDFIEHLSREEALRFLNLCNTSLKPGGRLILQTPNADSPLGLQICFGDITHEWMYNVNLLTRLLRGAGFVNIQPREQGPVPLGYSLLSTSRWIVWRMIRTGLQLWNLSETGERLPVMTRVFLISGMTR